MSINDFIIGKELGKGAFGSVSLVTRKRDGKVYAMKRVNIGKLNKKEKESSLNEIRILASLSHPNIIGYKEAFFDEKTNTLNIVMEFAEEGDLEKKIKNNLKKRLNFEEETIWKWIIQLLKGIKYLHENRIMHRDLKCANIFLMKNGLVKLGDLNVSKFAKFGLASTQTGTPYYCSPEIWNEKSYDYKSDIWSLGCIIYEICSLRPPFRGTSLKGLRNNVLNGHYLPIPSIYSRELSILISKMLVIDPNKRASANELVNDEIVLSKIKIIRTKLYNKDMDENYKQEKANLIKTIRLPLNIKEINSKLPKKRYNPEEEMMKNDEYETMKQTFFQNLKKEEEKNINNDINRDNGFRELKSLKTNNNKSNDINNDLIKEIKKNNNFKKIDNHNSDLKYRGKANSIENKKEEDYYINRNFKYRYEQALNNNHKLKKFNTKNNYEERKIRNNGKHIESPEKSSVLMNNYLLKEKNKGKNFNKHKTDDNDMIMNNINKSNFIQMENHYFPFSPYNLIINKNSEKNNNIINNNNINIIKKNRYKNLFEDEVDEHNKHISEIIRPSNHPQSALVRQKKLNFKPNEMANNKLNKHKSRASTSNPSNRRLNKNYKNPKLIYQNKNNVKVNNLYDKYKNKNKNIKVQKPVLYEFKYIPQKRKNNKIAYDKVNYNDYCKKNNIDKNKNYHYYRENGYYNYRNAMKKYGNFVKNKNMNIKRNNHEKDNQNKFNIYLKNEYKGGGGAGYAARIRMQKYK